MTRWFDGLYVDEARFLACECGWVVYQPGAFRTLLRLR